MKDFCKILMLEVVYVPYVRVRSSSENLQENPGLFLSLVTENSKNSFLHVEEHTIKKDSSTIVQ